MSVKFTRHPDAVRALLGTPEAVAAIGELAAIAGQSVQRNMPVVSGYNVRSISSTARVVDGIGVGYVTTSSSVWHILEYGSAQKAPRRPFARGIKAAGLDYKATGR